MIIGNGDIGKALKDRDDVVFFASGVSNSQETDEKESLLFCLATSSSDWLRERDPKLSLSEHDDV